MSPQHGETESLWTARPAVARSIRVFVFIAPLLISVVVAWALSAIAPNPATFAAGVLRWVLIAFVSTLVLLAVDKLARRLLPLSNVVAEASRTALSLSSSPPPRPLATTTPSRPTTTTAAAAVSHRV